MIFVKIEKPQGRIFVMRLRCDDYPEQAPELRFVAPAAFDQLSEEWQPAAEFCPRGDNIVNEPQRLHLPVPCIKGHRDYYAEGWHQGLSGEYSKAAADLEQALAVFNDLGDDRWAARTRLSTAALRRREDGWDDARHHASSALDTFRQIQDRPAQGWALRELGIILREQEHYDEAISMLAESERIFADLGDRLWQARAIACHARVDQCRGEDPSSRLDQAAALCRLDGIADVAKVTWILSEW